MSSLLNITVTSFPRRVRGEGKVTTENPLNISPVDGYKEKGIHINKLCGF